MLGQEARDGVGAVGDTAARPGVVLPGDEVKADRGRAGRGIEGRQLADPVGEVERRTSSEPRFAPVHRGGPSDLGTPVGALDRPVGRGVELDVLAQRLGRIAAAAAAPGVGMVRLALSGVVEPAQAKLVDVV